MYLKQYFKTERVVDFDMLCYIKNDNVEKYSEIIKKVEDRNLSIVLPGYYHDEIVKSLHLMKMKGVQFIGPHRMVIQKLSKSWPL